MADTTVTVTEDVTSVTIEADTAITITEDVTEVDITASTPVSITSAGGISFNAYGGISSTNVQSALQELADQFTITTSQPGSRAPSSSGTHRGGSMRQQRRSRGLR